MTALTPGSAAAFDVLIDRIRACACGERRILPPSCPGIAISAAYIARPVTFGTPAGRIGRVPTHLNPVTTSFTAISLIRPQSYGLSIESRGPAAQTSP